MRAPVGAVLLTCLTCSILLAETVTSRVLDPDGNPVAGATVVLVRYGSVSATGFAPVATATTDADGAFTLVDEGEPPPGTPTLLNLCAWKEGFAPAHARVRGPQPPPPPPGMPAAQVIVPDVPVLKFHRPLILPGKLQDPQGQPIAGATVELTMFTVTGPPRAAVRVYGEIGPLTAVTTDDDGDYRMVVGEGAERVGVSIRAPGYGSVRVDQMVKDALAPITLTPAGSLQGRILCPEQPDAVAGLQLRLYSHPSTSEMPYWQAQEYVTTDAQGSFALPELIPGKWTLVAYEQQQRPYQVPTSDFEIRSEEQTPLELRAEKAGQLQGRVIDAETGKGIAGATVSVQQESRGTYFAVPANAEGRYEAFCLPGTCSLTATAPAYNPGEASSAKVALTAEGATAPDLLLHKAAQVRVQVVDEAGKPVAGAAVSVSQDPQQAPGVPTMAGEAGTGAEGMAVVIGGSDGTMTLRATKGDLASEAIAVTPEEQNNVCRLVLRPGILCGLMAQLVDERGEPLKDARVTLYVHGPQYMLDAQTLLLEAPGVVRKSGLAPDQTYSLAVRIPGCYAIRTPRWTAERGQVHDFGTLRLSGPHGTLAGVVVDEQGQPLADITVSNTFSGPDPVTTTTDEQGRFRLEGLAEGEAYAFASREGSDLVAVSAPTGTQDIRLVLKPSQPGTFGPPPPLRPPVLADEEAMQLARQLLLKELERPLSSDDYYAGRLLALLGRIDSRAAFDLAGRHNYRREEFHGELGKALLPASFEEGMALFQQLEEPMMASYFLLQAVQEYVQTQPDVARRCLAELQATLPGLPMLEMRVMMSGMCGQFLRELGDPGGEELLRTSAEEAGRLTGTDGAAMVRAMIAGALCDIDLEAALKLVEALDPATDGEYEAMEARTIVARHVAMVDPDRALRLLGEDLEDRTVEESLIRVLPFFPPEQFPRAREMARALADSTARGVTLARLCRIAPPEDMAGLLEEARAALADPSGRSYSGTNAGGMARLACVARRMGYSRAGQIVLHAASLPRQSMDWSWTQSIFSEDLAAARVIALHDPVLARQVVEGILRGIGGPQSADADIQTPLVEAAAEVDPRWAVELLEQFPHNERRSMAVAAIAEALLSTPEDRETTLLSKNYQYNWLATDRDLDW